METMTIQWSLVLFTALTGIGGWTFVCVAADEFLSRAKAAAFPAAVVAFALSAVGGLASVTHLSHPDRIMGALGHPTSGIFTEAVLVGCVCVFVAIYLVMLKRGASDGARKAVAVIGAVFGVLISFMAGESYLMSSRPNWDTQLLPLATCSPPCRAASRATLRWLPPRRKRPSSTNTRRPCLWPACWACWARWPSPLPQANPTGRLWASRRPPLC